MVVHDLKSFKQAIRDLILSDSGLAIESQGDLFIRSLGPDGDIAVGSIGHDGCIDAEKVFPVDEVEAAISYFCDERKRLSHGSMY